MKAMWRQFEEKTVEERLKEFDTDTDDEISIVPVPYNIIIVHDKKWIKLRRSFRKSKEWEEFRLNFLKKHPKCNRCRKKAKVVHHISPFTLDTTVIHEGFLFGLKFENRFEALCGDCHYLEHEDLIESEKGIRGQSKK